MKFADNVLLEIVSIVSEGLAKGEDISQKLRDIDVDLEHATTEYGSTMKVKLSDMYLASKGRVF